MNHSLLRNTKHVAVITFVNRFVTISTIINWSIFRYGRFVQRLVQIGAGLLQICAQQSLTTYLRKASSLLCPFFSNCRVWLGITD